jgi:beta-glucanase (GH16 family)
VFGQTVTAGKTAKLYAEGETKNCMLTNTGQYAVKHNPWAYFVDSTERTPCNANDVPTTKLDADITAGTLPVTGMVVPNLCNDAHDCALSVADNWFKSWMQKIFAGPDWASGRLAVVLTADEDDKLSGNKVLTVVIHPAVSAKVVSTPLTHYSLTRFYEDAAGTTHLNGAGSAPDMATAFGLYPGIAPPPTTTTPPTTDTTAPTTTAPTTTAPTTTAPTTDPTTTTPPTTDPTTTIPTTTTPTTPPLDPKWTLALEDHFDGTDLDSTVWRKYGETSDWPGHNNNGLRVARAVTVQDGAAVITAQMGATTGKLESGAFTLRSLYTQYGRFEARIKVDPDPSGVMSAVALTWPVDNNSCSGGENDFAETGRQRLNFKTYIHYACGSQVSFTHLYDPTAWHDVIMEWEPNRLAVYVDGVLDKEWTDPAIVPDWVHRLTFQYDAFAPDMGTTVTKMWVDDVKVWTLTP